jgi:CelD/BcsL family acetyltransferase involved in cellulose biosynthesis
VVRPRATAGPKHALPIARTIRVRDVDERLLARWRALAATAAEANPFFEPEVVLPAARLLPGGDSTELLIVEQRSALLFVLPLVPASRFRRVPVPAVTSWHHDHSFLGTPLVAPGAGELAWSAAIGHLRSARRAPWLVLPLLPTEGPVVDGLAAALLECGLRATTFDPHSRAVVRRRDEPTYLDQTVGPRRRKNLRRLRRRLGERLDADVVTVDRAAAGELRAGQGTFLEIEASGWKGRSGGALASRPEQAQFFREVCDGFAAVERLQLWTLGSATQTVAASCNFIAGDSVFHFKIAYDEDFARCSPGVQLELDMLDAFHADPRLEFLDSCTAPGHSVSDELYPDSRSLQTLLLPLYGPRGLAAARATPPLAKAYRRLRASRGGRRRENGCES